MENIYTASKPFYNLIKFLGLFPMSYDGPEVKGCLKVHRFDVISTIISWSFCVFLFSLGLIFEDGTASTSAFLSQVWVIHHLFGNACVLIISFYQNSKYRSIANFLAAVENFDKKV